MLRILICAKCGAENVHPTEVRSAPCGQCGRPTGRRVEPIPAINRDGDPNADWRELRREEL